MFKSFLTLCNAEVLKYYSLAEKNYTDQTTIIASCNKRLSEITVALEANQAQMERLTKASTSAQRRSTALSSGTPGGSKVSPKDRYSVSQYMVLLRCQQPYTDGNGFEQIGGFPWGRSVSVTSAADTLRLDATARKFLDMTPQVVSKKSNTLLSKTGGLPYVQGASGVEAVSKLQDLRDFKAKHIPANATSLTAGSPEGAPKGGSPEASVATEETRSDTDVVDE
jgi:uncharacterized coiled-coil protein SlyX